MRERIFGYIEIVGDAYYALMASVMLVFSIMPLSLFGTSVGRGKWQAATGSGFLFALCCLFAVRLLLETDAGKTFWQVVARSSRRRRLLLRKAFATQAKGM